MSDLGGSINLGILVQDTYCIWMHSGHFLLSDSHFGSWSVDCASCNLCRVCLSKGIPFREVAPSWSESEFWAEAFITSKPLLISSNFKFGQRKHFPRFLEYFIIRFKEIYIAGSLRLLQHAETISFPSSWESLNSKSWGEISWKDKHFEVCTSRVLRCCNCSAHFLCSFLHYLFVLQL